MVFEGQMITENAQTDNHSRGCDEISIGVDPGKCSAQHIKRQFGKIKGYTGQVPAFQQDIAAENIGCLQHLVGMVGVDRNTKKGEVNIYAMEQNEQERNMENSVRSSPDVAF